MTIKRLLVLLGCLSVMVSTVLFSSNANFVQAQEEAVVYAVLFYSPTCSHCNKVMEEDIPPLLEQYGSQLQILYVNITEPEGRAIFAEACATDVISESRCGSVPNMIVGETVMTGSVEIPTMLPELIENGLSEGGVGLPTVSGLQETYDAIQTEQNAVNLFGNLRAINHVAIEQAITVIEAAMVEMENIIH